MADDSPYVSLEDEPAGAANSPYVAFEDEPQRPITPPFGDFKKDSEYQAWVDRNKLKGTDIFQPDQKDENRFTSVDPYGNGTAYDLRGMWAKYARTNPITGWKDLQPTPDMWDEFATPDAPKGFTAASVYAKGKDPKDLGFWDVENGKEVWRDKDYVPATTTDKIMSGASKAASDTYDSVSKGITDPQNWKDFVNPAKALDNGLGTTGEALKGLGGSFNQLGTAGAMAGAGGAVIADKVASIFTGKDQTAAQDWMFDNAVKPMIDRQQAFDVAKDAGLTGKIANGVGSVIGVLDQAILTGPQVAVEGLLARAGIGAASMSLPAVTQATDIGRQVYEKTNDRAAALKAATAAYLTTAASGAIPAAIPGKLATRVASGAAIGAGQAEGSRQVMNAALPASMQSEYSPEQSVEGAILGAGFGAMHGGEQGGAAPGASAPGDTGTPFEVPPGLKPQGGLPGPLPDYTQPKNVYADYESALHASRTQKDTAPAEAQVDKFRAAAERAQTDGNQDLADHLHDMADRLAKVTGLTSRDAPPESPESPDTASATGAPRLTQDQTDAVSNEPTASSSPEAPSGESDTIPDREEAAAASELVTKPSQEDSAGATALPAPETKTPAAEFETEPDKNETPAEKDETESATPDRRVDLDRRQRVDQMSPDEMRRELLTHELTGIPNRRAYEESEKLPVQAYIDADSLKWVNDTGGHEAGDQVLQAIATALHDATPGNAFHISGDEFTVQGIDHATVDKAIADARARLADATVDFTGPDGQKITLNGIGFSHGKGSTLAEADANLQAEKRQREQTGLRAARGEQPPGASRTPAAQGLPADKSRFTPEKRVVKPNERTRGPNPKKDSILQYLARHPRGLDREEAKRQGIDPADMGLATAHVGIRRAFRKGGISFDHAAETLSQEGYPVVDEDGRYSPNVLLERVSDELAGRPHFSTRNEEHTERLAAAEAEKQQLRADSAEIRSEHEPDVPALVDEPQHIQEWADLANAARKVDPDATDLTLEHPDDEVARQKLEEIVARSRPELAGDEAPRQSASPASGNRGEPPLLESYDQAEITRREQAEKDRLAAESEAERKAEADKDREQFALTGSARAADANPGQADLVGFTPQGKTPKPQVGKSAEPKKIDDVGEKIGGARKDRWAKRGMDLSDLDSMSEGEAAQLVRKDAVWKPDWAALVAGGMTKDAAALNKVMWDKLAAKPRVNSPAGRRNYLEALGKLRAIMEASKSATDVRGTQEKFMRAIDYNAAEDRYGRSSDPGVIAGRDKFWSIHGGRRSVLHPANPEVRAAKKLIESGFPEERIPWQQKYVIYPGTKDDGSREWRVYEKAGRNKVGTYENEAQAILAARDAYAKAKTEQPTGEKEKEGPPKRPHLDEIKREGLPTVRDGDAKPEDFLKDFGFRGLEFGNWAANDERQKLVNLAYDALHDLAMVLNVPPKALSLNGTLGLALGARGGGFGVAHYEPGKLVINMTKLSGAGSLAHEFGHALDHYFGEMGRPDAYKTDARGATGWYGDPKTSTWAHLRPEMQEAWRTVMDAMFTRNKTQAEDIRDRELNLEKLQAELRQQETRHAAAVERETPDKKYLRDSAAWIAQRKNIIASAEKRLEEARSAQAQGDWGRTGTAYKAASEALSGGKSSGYWRRPTEMFARAFESFVEDKLAERGAVSQYLVHSTTEPHQRNDKGDPYPREDRPAINSALQHLVDTLETRQEGDKIAVFERTKAYNSAQIPLNFDGEPVKATFATRPDTTTEDVRRGLSDLVMLRDRRAGAAVLGNAIPAAFASKGTVSLIGQRVGSIHDLALLQQANRRPDFEVLHLIFTKGDQVVHHTAMSSRLPGAAKFQLGEPGKDQPIDYVRAVMKAQGADGYWISHNHPSGKSQPSLGPQSDETFTYTLHLNVPGFKGHVVIDSHEYSTMTVNPRNPRQIDIATHSINGQAWNVGESAPRVPHKLLGARLDSPQALARIQWQIGPERGGVHVFAVSSNPNTANVRALTWFPKELVNYRDAKTKAEKLRVVARLRRVGIGSGGSWLFAIGDNAEILKTLPPIFQDVMVSGDSGTFIQDNKLGERVPNLGRRVSPAYQVREAEKQPTFYSAVSRAVDAAKREKGTGPEWEATLRNMPGVKPEEMQWLGLKDWLQGRGRVTRAEVADYVKAHVVQITPAMREGVSQGLPLFEPQATYGNSDSVHAPQGTYASGVLTDDRTFLGRPGIAGKVYDLARRAAMFPFTNKLAMDVRKLVNPRSLSEESKLTAQRIVPFLADLARQKEMVLERFEQYSRDVDRFTYRQQLQTYHEAETGQSYTHPELGAIEEAVKKMLRETAEQVQAMGPGHLDHFIDNYLPHYYTDEAKAKKFFAGPFGRRPLKGPATFKKQRYYATMRDAMEKGGLKPLSANPLIQGFLKIYEMHRYMNGVAMARALKDDGYAEFFPMSKRIPEGWKEIDDPAFRVSQWSEAERGFVQRGRYAMPEDGARLLNNHLGVNHLANFSPAMTLRALANSMTMFQLGFSGFHLGFTSTDALISKNAIAYERLMNGEIGRAAAAFAEAYSGPVGVLMNLSRGRMLKKAYLDPRGSTPELQILANALVSGGGRIRMGTEYDTARGMSPFHGVGAKHLIADLKKVMRDPDHTVFDYTKTLGSVGLEYATKYWRTLKEIGRVNGVWGAPFNLLGRTVRASTAFIMDKIVPWQKQGAFMDMARDYLRRNPNATPTEVNAEMQKAWHSIDNRLGEVVYDNSFWNRSFKMAMHLSLRAVGWRFGTLQELGGGAHDFLKAADTLLRTGRLSPKDFTHKMAYLMALLTAQAISGALLQYALTGESPRDLKDLMFPRTGYKEKDGSDERLSIPTYMKDMYGYLTQPGHEVASMLNPILGELYYQIQGTDYWGDPLYDPNDSGWEQFLDRAHHFLSAYTPFVVENNQQSAMANEPGVAGAIARVGNFFGVKTAPKAITNPEGVAETEHYLLQKKWEKELRYDLQKADQAGDKEEADRLRARIGELKAQDRKEHAEYMARKHGNAAPAAPRTQNAAPADDAKARIREEARQRRSGQTSQVIDHVNSLVDQGGDKEAIAARIHAAGYPALAGLIRAVPDTLRPQVKAKLAEYA